ncbi:MAG: TetR family transcriptional regulator C-terminal domain-containing protein [Aquirufa sp.]
MIDKIISAYINHIREEGQSPKSLYSFAKSMDLEEKDLYAYFTSFEGLENIIWSNKIQTTIQNCQSDPVYASYSVREKYLSFVFSFFQELLPERSFFIQNWKKIAKPTFGIPEALKSANEVYLTYVQSLMDEAIESNEVKARKYLDKKYADGLWFQFIMIIQFWVKDSSPNFEKTDEFIEKSTQASFELLGVTAFDSLIDLGKFLIQNKTGMNFQK